MTELSRWSHGPCTNSQSARLLSDYPAASDAVLLSDRVDRPCPAEIIENRAARWILTLHRSSLSYRAERRSSVPVAKFNRSKLILRSDRSGALDAPDWSVLLFNRWSCLPSSLQTGVVPRSKTSAIIVPLIKSDLLFIRRHSENIARVNHTIYRLIIRFINRHRFKQRNVAWRRAANF